MTDYEKRSASEAQQPAKQGNKDSMLEVNSIADYYVLFGKEQQGPYTMEQLKQLIQSGQLVPDTMVWKEGMSQWSKAGDCLGLKAIFGEKTMSAGEEKIVPPTAGPISEEKAPATASGPIDGKQQTTKAPGGKKWIPAVIAGAMIIIGIALFFVFTNKGNTIDYSLIPVCNDGERWGFINRKGEYVINPQFEDADFFSTDGLAKIKSGGGKTGYINKKGEYVIPASYKGGTAFGDGLAFVVAGGGLPTCIDKRGDTKFVFNMAKYVSAFSDGLAIFITEDGEYGFVDKNGNIAINAQFEMAFPFHEGLARFLQKGDAGFIDKTGKFVINAQFKAIGNFSEEKAAFSNGKQWGYINKQGAYVINPQYDDADRFSSGLAAIKQGRSYGYIDKTGRLVINPQFDHASTFSDGLAAVRAGDKYGYINKDGKYEINTQFEFAGDFYSGIALVRAADKWGFINKKGQYVVNPQFKNVKNEASIEAPPDFIESDYYDTSEFIKLFFEREAGNTFDGINASTTLEALSNHPAYGAGVSAQGFYFAEYNQTIPLTKDISIRRIMFYFAKKPIYIEVETYNSWGNRSTRREMDFSATPDAIMYDFGLSGKASEKRSVLIGALRTEIERRNGQTMNMENNAYRLYQDNGKFNYVVGEEGGSIGFVIAFNKEGMK